MKDQIPEQIVEKNETPEPSEEIKEPTYFRQISPEKTSTDEYKGLHKYQTIDALCDRVIELEKSQVDTSRMIEVPDGKDPEKVREFASKLGVPENPDDYKIAFLDREGNDKETVSAFKKDLAAAMLTKAQANAVGNALFRMAKKGLEKTADAYKTKRDTFDATLTASYSDIQVDADRQAAAKRDRESFEGFAAESGLKEMLEKNGMAYDADFVKGVAKYARKHSGQNNPSPTPGGGANKTGKNTIYTSSDMERRYGNAR